MQHSPPSPSWERHQACVSLAVPLQDYQSAVLLRHAVWVGQRRKEEEERREALLASAARERRLLMDAAAQAKREAVPLVVS